MTGPSTPRLAILGAGGFLGSHLVTALVERGGWHIRALDRCFDKLDLESEAVERVVGSVGDPALLARVLADCSVVFSLTAICNPSRYNQQPREVIRSNYDDLLPLVELCTERRLWLVHFSTCEVYGRPETLRAQSSRDSASRDPTGVAMREDETALVLGPIHRERWSYACAKQLAERLLWGQGLHAGLPLTIIRPFNVVGPRMDFIPGVDGDGVPRVLASFMGALLRGEPLPLVDGGHQRRSFVYVDDFIEAVCRVLDYRGSVQQQILNLGNPGNDTTIAGLAALMIDAFCRRLPKAKSPGVHTISATELYGEGYDDTMVRIPDISKAKRLLHWEPTTTLEKMVPTIVDAYVERYHNPRPRS